MRPHLHYLTLFLLLFSAPVFAAESAPLFEDSTLLSFRLVGPFTRIDQERDKESEYSGFFIYTEANGSELTLDVTYEVRGNNRLKRDICSFSQLWVNFRKSQVEGTLLEGQDKLKLVVQCRNGDNYQDYIVREQQAYDLFNLLSPYSFRTRLAQISYEDSEKNKNRTHLGFFIEHHKGLADRLELDDSDLEKISKTELDPLQSTLASLFMFFVSNTDYSMITGPAGEECCHNIKLLTDAAGVYYPIPYDFDASGFVNARYAVPASELKQNSIRDRMYRGFCVAPDIMAAALDRYREQQSRIEQLISANELHSARGIDSTNSFVSKFFDIIDEDRTFQRNILDECR